MGQLLTKDAVRKINFEARSLDRSGTLGIIEAGIIRGHEGKKFRDSYIILVAYRYGDPIGRPLGDKSRSSQNIS